MKVLIEFEGTREAIDNRANLAPQPFFSVTIFPSRSDSGICDGTAKLLVGDVAPVSDGGPAAIGRETIQKAPYGVDQASILVPILRAQSGTEVQTQGTPVGVSDGGSCHLATPLFRTS